MNAQEVELAQDREFEFTDTDFARIRTYVKENTGINLSEAKKNMVYSRLSRRLRQLDTRSFAEYWERVIAPDSDEKGSFINAITTNLTAFFRENHHFEFLRDVLLPELVKQNQRTRRLRIWSAGCSTGEEPYSIAMTILENVPDASHWDIKILATDLDTNVLAHATAGVYDLERINGISDARKRRWFQRGQGKHSGSVRVAKTLRDIVNFRQLNLMGKWPMSGKFDFMFCRNVIIYFDKPTQKVLFDRYAELLADNAHIFLGHSETLYSITDRYELLGKTIYKKLR